MKTTKVNSGWKPTIASVGQHAVVDDDDEVHEAMKAHTPND